jgi:hypothetical protein
VFEQIKNLAAVRAIADAMSILLIANTYRRCRAKEQAALATIRLEMIV